MDCFKRVPPPTEPRAALIRGLVDRKPVGAAVSKVTFSSAGTSLSHEDIIRLDKVRELERLNPGFREGKNDFFLNGDGRMREAGGFHDLLKADSKQQRFTHLRITKTFQNKHTVKALSQLKTGVQHSVPEGDEPCMCVGTTLGRKRENCIFNPPWVDMLDLVQIKAMPMY